jgi:hypothetical protein
MNMIRKTILLQHPSGSQALQDLSLACKMGAFAAYPEGQTPNAPGDMCPVPADRSQPDECLLTMSNNICDPAGKARLPSQKNVLSSDKSDHSDRNDQRHHQGMVEPDGIEPTTS